MNVNNQYWSFKGIHLLSVTIKIYDLLVILMLMLVAIFAIEILTSDSSVGQPTGQIIISWRVDVHSHAYFIQYNFFITILSKADWADCLNRTKPG